MLMKSFARNKTLLNSVRFFTTADAKKTTLKEQTSLSFRFHQLYVQELERLKSNSY